MKKANKKKKVYKDKLGRRIVICESVDEFPQLDAKCKRKYEAMLHFNKGISEGAFKR